METIGIILLAGGRGERMGACCPKQFLPLKDKPLALYSFEVFDRDPSVSEIVVVCDTRWRNLFQRTRGNLLFACPGARRQDSVYNGLKALQSFPDLVCIHDSARPFIPSLAPLFKAASLYGAATFGVPVNFTVKETDENAFVTQTLNRQALYEIQTPQVIRYPLLLEGFQALTEDVTDDVSIIEKLGHPVTIVPGDPLNFKITVPKDLDYAEYLLERKEHAPL